MVTPRLPSRAFLSASCDFTSASQKKKLFLTPKRRSDKAGTRKSEAGYEGYTVTRNLCERVGCSRYSFCHIAGLAEHTNCS